MSKIFNKKNIYLFTCLLIILHPIIELDYLIYPFLNTFNLPRLTTIINMLIYPLIVIITFILFEKEKKKILIYGIPYLLIILIYFIFHSLNAYEVQELIYLPNNYWYSLFDEAVYMITLLLPLIYIYVFYKEEIKDESLKTIVYSLSLIIALPIFIANIFIFGFSTYEGNTIDNIFSWFSLPFNEALNHPRYYASKFFFEEGNTIGIIMMMILPLMYYFFLKEKDKIKKIIYGLLIFIQSIAMMILTTRVATICAFLIPAVIIIIYLILIILKYEILNKLFLGYLIIMTIICANIYPYSPAYQNQKIDAKSYEFQKTADIERSLVDAEYREGAKGLEKYSEDWLNFYTNMFEVYSWFIRVTPPIYYMELYDYRHDPEFWVNLMFDYELEERINGRQIQTIFTNYKWNDYDLTNIQKSLGLGYSTFMHGGIILERDFARQYYAFGIIGFSLMMLPWLIMILYSGIKLILGYKKRKWTFLNILLMMSICMVLGTSYLSGHTFDQLSASMIVSLFISILFRKLKEEKVEY